MPVFTIETPGGQKLDIEAADQDTAVKGAQEWYSKNGNPSTGYVDALKHGASNVLGGLGETADQYLGGAFGAGGALKRAGEYVAPTNYKPAEVVSKEKGFQLGELPRAVTEQGAGLGATLAAARAAGIPGAVLAGLAMTAGRRAKERAEFQGREEPTTSDKVVGGLASIPEAAIGGLAVSRFLPGAGKVATSGTQGVVDSAKQFGLRAADQAAGGAASNLVAQVGKTAGTEKGLTIDPYETANAAVVQGATGGAFSAPKLVKDTSGAVRRANTAEETSAVANRIKDAAGTEDLTDPKVGFHAFQSAKKDLVTELTAASKAVPAANLSPEATGVLARAAKGETLNARDFEHLKAAGAEAVIPLSKQAAEFNKLQKTGYFNTEKGTFKGGLSAGMENKLRLIYNPYSAAAGLTLGAAGAGMIGAVSPAAVGGVYGAYLGARALNRITGSRSPAGKFTSRYANPEVGVRPSVPGPAVVPPRTPQSPTGPGVPPAPPAPWGSPSPPEPRYNPRPNIQIDEGMARVAKTLQNEKRKQAVADVTPLLRELATRAKAQGTDALSALTSETAPVLAKITKANGAVKQEMAPAKAPASLAEFPKADYAHMTPNEAANYAADRLETRGDKYHKSRADFVKYVAGVLTTKEGIASALTRAVPGVDPVSLKAILHGARTREEAAHLRAVLKAEAPTEAHSLIDTALSDKVIQHLWKSKKK